MFEDAKEGSVSRSHSTCTSEMRGFFCFLMGWWGRGGRGVSRSFLYSNNLSRLKTIHSTRLIIWNVCFHFSVHRLDTQLTKENLIRLYPSIFHIYQTQYNLEDLVVQGYNTFSKVNQTFDDGNKCSFSCTKGSTIGRRKRATSNDVYHACCVS